MANKDKLNTDRFDLDSELDLDNFGIESIDSQINPEVRTGSKSRKVIGDVFKGTISGAKDQFRNPSFLAKMAKDSLPGTYGEVFKAGAEFSASTTRLYDEAVKEIKPQLAFIAKKIDRLVPDEQKRLKKFTSKVSSRLTGYEQTAGLTREQLMDQGVANALAQTFAEQQQQFTARQTAETRIKDQVEGKRFESNFGILSSINENSARLTMYTEKVTQAFQKKSLELQYRSYFVQSELLQTTSKFFEVFKNQNEAIAKNTSLPEYAKINLQERILQTSKEKFSSKANDFFFGDESVIGRGFRRIGEQAREYVSGVKQGLEAALMGMDAAEDISSSLDGTGLSKSTLAGNMLGQKAADVFGGWIAKRINKWTENSRKAQGLRNVGGKAANAVNNIPGAIDSFQKSKAYQDLMASTGLKGKAAMGLDWFFNQFKDMKQDMSIKDPFSANNLGMGGKFDVRTQRSIVEVIPGFLSRILREITVLRTGNTNEKALSFDFSNGKFATDTQIAKSMNAMLAKKASASSQGFAMGNLMGNVAGAAQLDPKVEAKVKGFFAELNKDPSVRQTPSDILSSKQFKKLDKETAAAVKSSLEGNASTSETSKNLKKFFLNVSKMDNMSYDPESIKATSAYKDLDPSTRALLDKYFAEKLSGDDNSGNQNGFTKRMMDLRRSTPDLRSDIQSLIENGQGRLLEKEGLVKRDENGNYQIVESKYFKLTDSALVDSDINVKKNIKPLSPKAALEAIKKTKIYNWLYKKGKGDSGEHNGPMAQDVNRTMGEEAAPDGTKIDLTSMNGNNMAAIQALSDKQDEMMGSEKDSLSALRNISSHTKTIVDMLSGKYNAGSIGGSSSTSSATGSPRTYEDILGGMFGGLGRLVGKGVKDVGRASATVASKLGPMVGTAASGLNKAYDKIKDPSMRALSFIMHKAGEVSMKALEIGQDTLFNKLPQGFNKAKDLADWAKDKAKQLIARARDVYIKGESNPVIKAALLKAGYYRDQATNKIIRTMGDLKNLKGNVVNAAGEVILTIEDAGKGLVDNKGEAIKTGLERLANWGKAAMMRGFGRAGKFLGGAMEFGGKMLGKLGNMNFDLGGIIGFGNKRIYEVLVEMRDMMRQGAGLSAEGGTGSDSFIGPMPQKLGGKLGSTVSGWGRKLSVLGKRASRTGGKGLLGGITSGGLFTKLKGKFAGMGADAEGKPAFNDRDGSGKRDGSWEERAKVLAERDKANDKGALEMDKSAKYRSDENVIDTMMKKVSGVFDMAKTGLGSIFGSSGDMLETAGDVLGTSGKGGKKGVLGRIGGLLSAPFKATWNVAKGIGKAGFGAGKLAVQGTGLLAKGAMFAARNPMAIFNGARTAAMAVGLMTGGVGSAIAGGIGMGLSAIGAILSSPVVLGGLAVAAVGYGAYKLYKYYNRNSVSDLDEIRMLQYGLTKNDADHYHKFLGLEAYLNDNRVGYDNGKAYIIDKKVDKKDLITFFKIDENDEEMCSKFAAWYSGRFKPFFLTHHTALYAVDKKLEFSNLGKLSAADKVKYLSLVGFDGGPYTVTSSPMKELPSLTDTKEATLSLIKTLLDKYNKAAEGNKTSSAGKTVAAAAAASTIAPKVAAAPLSKSIPAAPIKTAATVAASTAVANQYFGEEGKETIVSRDSVRGGNGMPKLFIADGEMKDGSGADQYMRLQPGVNLDGLNPAVKKNLRAMIQEYGEKTGKTVTITSGARSSAEQEALWRKDPKKAAKPGNSLHEFGLAIDADSDDLDAMDKAGLMRKYGFTRPIGGEPWHMEPIGIQANLALARKDASFAEQATAASLNKGGGGAGTMDGVALGKRRPELSLAIMQSNGEQKTNLNDKDIVTAALQPRTGGKAANDSTMSNNVIKASFNQGASYSKTNSLPTTISNAPVSLSPDAEVKPSSVSVSGPDPVNTGSQADVKNAIMTIAKKSGADPQEMALLAAVESSMNPNARASTSTASGPFQFTRATWQEQMGKNARRLGLDPNTPPTDLTASTLMASEYVKANRKAISSVRPNPNMTDVYLAHFLGAGGARKFLSANPDAIAAQILPDAAKANQAIFYQNGRALTVAEVYSKIDAKLTKTAKDYGISLPGNNTFSANANNVTPITSAPSSVSRAAQTAATATGSSIPRGTLSAASNTVISAPSVPSIQQRASSASSDFSGAQAVLTKQLEIQAEMRDVLREISGKIDTSKLSELLEAFMTTSKNSATPVVGTTKGVQSIKSAIDLGRKVA